MLSIKTDYRAHLALLYSPRTHNLTTFHGRLLCRSENRGKLSSYFLLAALCENR